MLADRDLELRKDASDPGADANPWAVAGALLAIVGISLAGNLYWLARNVVLIGRDASGHLDRTLKAAELLAQPSWQTPFQLLTLHDYRPPLLYIAAQPFYLLFGRSMDSAQLTNVTLLAAVLLLTFALARRVSTPAVALLATALVAFLPMMAFMARLFYMEHLLTALLLANLMALLAVDGYRRPGWALLWGASLGGALLVKWTSPIYIVLPTLFIVWKAGLFPAQWAALRSPRVHWPKLGLGLAIALPFVLLWYLPNRAFALDELPLGDALPLLWLILGGLFVYSRLLPPTPLRNFWSGLLLALLAASLWYLPRMDFVYRLTDVAFGTDRGRQESLDLLRLENYTRYLSFWVNEHMGRLASLLILPVALWAWVKRRPRWREARPAFAVLWLMVLSAFVFLTLLAQATTRNLAPLTPAIAILLADSLRAYSRPVALGWAAAWVAVLAVQWGVYTFDGAASFLQRTAALWVSGDYAVQPATGPTDPGYWIQPDVLATIGSPPGDPASFGMLVDSWELHRGSFRYLIREAGLNIDLKSLTDPGSITWGDLWANQWLLLKLGDNRDVSEPGLGFLQRILDGDALFDLLYAKVKEYPLPNGDIVRLYRRTAGPAHPSGFHQFPVVLIDTSTLADAINAWWSDAATLYIESPELAAWLGIHDLRADRVVLPAAHESSSETPLAASFGTLLVATRYHGSKVHDWLRQHAYYAREVSSHEFTLSVFGRPERPLQALPSQAAWDELALTDVRTWPVMAPGEVLPVELTAAGRTDGSLKISARLVDPDGQTVAQNDNVVTPQLRFGLLLPPDAAPGAYSLAAVVYDPVTLAPLPDEAGQEQTVIVPIQVSPTP